MDLTILPYPIRNAIWGRPDRFNNAASGAGIEDVGAPTENVGSRAGDEQGNITRMTIPVFGTAELLPSAQEAG
jgi:hypothetical protein